MTDAEQHATQPDQATLDVLPELERIAASGGSEAVWQRELTDGSMLLVRVREGQPAVYEPVPPPDSPDDGT